MKPEDVMRFTERCFRGEPASCSYACPFHMDVRAFLDKVSGARWVAAYKILRNATVFPAIVSELCDQPCQEHCQRTVVGDEPIAIRDVEAACVRYTRDRRPEAYVVPPKEQRVAVVGAGLAGLSCALNLAQKKYRVTVFEEQDGWGGRLRTHPRWGAFVEEIALQYSAVEVDFRFGSVVRSLDELSEYDALYVATGSEGDSFGLLEGWEPESLMTSCSGVFLGGGLTGTSLMGGIAQGVEASKIIEAYLQTGKPARAPSVYDKANRGRYLDHTGAIPTPRVRPTGKDGYTAEEARAEASRCLKCDCEYCLSGCEMLKRFRKDPQKIAVEAYSDLASNPFSSRTVTRLVYSCNICGYCRSVCPEDVDIGALCRFSRAARMSAGIHPAAFHDFWLREMDFAVEEGAFAGAPKGKTECRYAFYPGCQLGALNPEYVLKSYEMLARQHDMGIVLGCCGAPAYWAGDEARLEDNLKKIKCTWEGLGRPILVFACATCMSLFRVLLPEIQRVSLYELLAELDSLPHDVSLRQAVVFDPCAARDNTCMEGAVRRLAVRMGVEIHELPERNRCCGYGGHIRVANPDLYDEIIRHRAGADERPYVVYCANCKEVFQSRQKECFHLLDLVLRLPAQTRTPTLQEKRKNSIRVKGELMRQIQDVDFQPERHPWDAIELVIPDDVQREMEEKLIPEAILKEAIWQAETTGDKFCDENGKLFVAGMFKSVITYWVEYRKLKDNTYEVLYAYSHRMRVKSER